MRVQTNGPFWWTILTCIKVMWYCLAMNYFWCCLNQMPKPLIRGSYILRIEKYEECWLTEHSDDLLVKLNEKSDTLSYKPLFKNCFYKLIHKHFFVYVYVKQKLTLMKTEPHICFIWFGLIFCFTVSKFLRFWCYLSMMIENQGLFSYSRYNLCGIGTVF